MHAEITLTNKSNDNRVITLVNTIKSPAGKVVDVVESQTEISAGATVEVVVDMEVASPVRWDVENPAMYELVTEVVGDDILDTYSTPFGIRTFSFDVDKGFTLNGRNMKLLGVCMHHDMGALGTTVHRRALQRQLEVLRSFGVNAIRTSHNPPAPELLDLCDEMGFLVMDEAFDMWRRAKTKYDYARYFDEWHERDMADFVKRDRNHPSIIMWSVGNEILEQWDNHNDTFETLPTEQRNLLLNYLGQEENVEKTDEVNASMLLTRHMVATLKKYDNTRPVTAGCNETRPSNNL